MEYLKTGLKSVLGAQQGVQASGAETIERLVDRVQSSTLLDDRRDAVRALKALSKRFRLEVGAQGMDALIHVLQTDRADAEIIGFTLDSLCNVMSNETQEDSDESSGSEQGRDLGDLGGQFTEIFIKKSENVSLLLALLEEYDFHVRWPSVKLLACLLTNKPRDVQECVLVSPMGVSKLMDLLTDSREVIRNDALLLLIQLTKGNANIQKIVAFESAFDRLLDIIAEEGYSDGGIVVEDCLLLLLNLLKNNTSNQTFFKEGSFIQRITPFFEFNTSAEIGWSAQKVSNIHLMLQLVRTLVSPDNPLQVISSCQKVMNQSGLLKQLCSILMASGVPADILTETINTVSEIIRGSHGNQEYFASVTAPSTPPRPAIVVLLMSMVNERQPFILRCSVLYCFQSFLYKNELGQAQIIQTLLPSSTDNTTITAGQLLCGGLFSGDSLSNWFAAVSLSHALVENSTQKEQMLRVQLATSLGNPPVSLLKQCTTILQQIPKLQTRMGLLMLLCSWLSSCPIAVSHFLSNTTNVPYLTAQIGAQEGEENEELVQGLCAFLLGICVHFNDDSVQSFNKDSLRQIIAKRIGLETFVDKLSLISKNENYTKAAQKPQPKFKQSSDVLFDHEFTRLFKSLEVSIIKAVQMTQDDHSIVNGIGKKQTVEEHENIVMQYKDLIREQDQQLSEFRKQINTMQLEKKKNETQLEEFMGQVQTLKDQNALLKAHKGFGTSGKDESSSLDDILKLQQEVLELTRIKENQNKEIAEKNAVIEKLHSSSPQTTENQSAVMAEKTILSSRVSELESHLLSLKEQFDLQAKELSKIRDDRNNLQDRLIKSNEDKLRFEEKFQKLEGEKEALIISSNVTKDELDHLKKEQDDLLILLTDQDVLLSKYKSKCRELGMKIEDEEELEDEEEDKNEA